MTAAEAIELITRVRNHLREAPAYALRERLAIISDLVALQVALSVPASLCTRDELFDAVITADCDEETEGPSLLDNLLEQIEVTSIVAHLAQRRGEIDINQGPDGTWSWRGERGARKAGPAMGYATRAEAERAALSWLAEEAP